MNVLLPQVQIEAVLLILLTLFYSFWWPGDEHIDHVRKVLTLFSNTSVTLSLKKCDIFPNFINNLGHVICPLQLTLQIRTIEAIHQLEHPTSWTELQSLLCLTNTFLLLLLNLTCRAPVEQQDLERSAADLFKTSLTTRWAPLKHFKRRLWSPRYWPCYDCNGTILYTPRHETSRLAVSCYRSNRTKQIDQ